MNNSKFKVGDEVHIIKYGSLFWSYEKESNSFPVISENKEKGYKVYDSDPELVGQTGIVCKVTKTQGKFEYALEGPNKCAWYDEEQLEFGD
jgi:uncharacterized protein YodC (DUF2158 family)